MPAQAFLKVVTLGAAALLAVPGVAAIFPSPSEDSALSGVEARYTNAGRVSEVCFTTAASFPPILPTRTDCVATKVGRLSDVRVVKDGIATHTSIITGATSAIGPIPYLNNDQLVYVLALQDTIAIGGVNNAVSCFAIFGESGERNGLQTDETPGAHGLFGSYTQDWLLYSTCPTILGNWSSPGA